MDKKIAFTIRYTEADGSTTAKNFPGQSPDQCVALTTKYLTDATIQVLSVNMLTAKGIVAVQQAVQAQQQAQQPKAFTPKKK